MDPLQKLHGGRLEIAIGQIGIALLAVGLLMFVITYIHWLFAGKVDN